MVSALTPLSFREAHLIVLIGNFTGNTSLRSISSVRVVGGGTETSRQFFSKSFVSSSKGTPWGEPSVFSHDNSGGSFVSICWRASSARLFYEKIILLWTDDTLARKHLPMVLQVKFAELHRIQSKDPTLNRNFNFFFFSIKTKYRFEKIFKIWILYLLSVPLFFCRKNFWSSK